MPAIGARALTQTNKLLCELIQIVYFLSLVDLKERFASLRERFQEEGMDVHSKGKFEWVDGILVKSLKEGRWLLIENVNFCRFVAFEL